MALPPPTKYNTLFAVEACFFDVSLLGSTFPEGVGEGGDPIRQSIDLLVIEPNEANEHTTHDMWWDGRARWNETREFTRNEAITKS